MDHHVINADVKRSQKLIFHFNCMYWTFTVIEKCSATITSALNTASHVMEETAGFLKLTAKDKHVSALLQWCSNLSLLNWKKIFAFV